MERLDIVSTILDRGLWSFTFRIPKVWLVIALSLVSNILTISIPFFLVMTMSNIWFSSEIGLYIGLASFLAALCGLQLCVTYIRDYLYHQILLKYSVDLAKESMYLFTKLPYSHLGNLPVETKYNRFLPLRNIGQFWFNDIFKPLLDLPMILMAMSLICFFMGVSYFIFISLIFLSIIFVSRIAVNRENIHKNYSEAMLHGTVTDVFNNSSLIKHHKMDDFFLKKIWKLIDEKVTNVMSLSIRGGFIDNIIECLLMSLYIFSVCWALIYTLSGVIGADKLILVILLIWFLISPIKAIIDTHGKFPRVIDTIKQLIALKNISTTVHRHKKIKLDESFKGTVELKSVNLKFADNSGFTLSNINFTAFRGEVILINGPSGSGKSTILKIISGLYQPMGGFCRIDVDQNIIDEQSLGSKLMLISRDSHIESETVINNLEFVSDEITKQKEQEILNKLNYSSELTADGIKEIKLRELKHGLHNDNLYQKALTRIILSKLDDNLEGKVILIDEPILENSDIVIREFTAKLLKLKKKNTIIICSRYNFYWALADKIIVMNEGSIKRYFKKNKYNE